MKHNFWKCNRRPGFTMAEMIVACGVFSMLMIFIYKVFIGGADSFNAGNWRITQQKSAQIFLSRIKDLLEKANYATQVKGGGSIASEALPIYINKDFLGAGRSCAGYDSQVMIFSIATSFVEGQADLGITANTKGTWSGVKLICKNRTLTLIRTGDWNAFNAAPYLAPADTYPPGMAGDYTGAGALVTVNTTLEDVSNLGIKISRGDVTSALATCTTILVSVDLVRLKNGKDTSAKIHEEVRAQLLLTDHEIDDKNAL